MVELFWLIDIQTISIASAAIGVLVYNGLIDVNLVRDLMGPTIISVWEKFEPILKRRRTDINWPDTWMPFEYLYNRVREEKRTFEI